jgi:hypothetical protein
MNSWDECGYTAYPLFKESGVPEPMIWEGVKGQPSKPVMPLDLNVRPIVDEKYIVPKTIEYIKKNASAKKPFFVYVGYSELHMPMMPNPNFANKSTERSGHIADCIAEMMYASARFWTPSRKRASKTTPSSSSVATMRLAGALHKTGDVRMELGAVISSTRRSKEACGSPP